MIPIEFRQTIKYKKKYDEWMAQYDYEDLPHEFKFLPPPEIQQEEYEASPDYKLKQQTKQSFSKEYQKLTEANSYFLGCNYHIYTSTYETRLKAFKDIYTDAEEHNFIVDEIDLINSYQFSDFIDMSLKKNIGYSLQKTQNYLRDKLKSLGYEIENTITKEGKVKSIATKGSSVIQFDNEPLIDLSDSNAKDKIRYLGLIGFFEFIKKREPYLNTNKIASLLSAITGCNQKTIQPYINPILSTEVMQDKNPLKDSKKVAEVRKQLINLGLNNIETV